MPDYKISRVVRIAVRVTQTWCEKDFSVANWAVTDITDQTGFEPPKSGTIKSCAFATGGLSQYIAFRGSDNHIYAMWNSIYPALGKWQIVDISKASGFPTTVVQPSTDPKGIWGVKNSVHFFFVGSDKHIHDIYADSYDGNGAWHWQDLTSAAVGSSLVSAAPNPSYTLGAYLWPTQGTQHVVYVGDDKDIHRLSFDGTWSDQNISAAAIGGPPPEALPHPVGFVWQSQGTEHIFYRGENDASIYELYYSNGQWLHNNLNKASKSQAAIATGAPDAYMFDKQGTEHVVFAGQFSDINSTTALGGIVAVELYFDEGWYTNNLYTAANLAIGQINEFAAGLTVSGYLFQYEETQHVIAVGGGHIIELYWNGSWNFNDLTAATGSIPPAGNSGGEWISLPVGFAWQDPFGNGSENFEAVVYIGGDGHIYQLSH